MFDPENMRLEFEKFLIGKGLQQRDLTLADGCEAVFDFYRDLRPRGHVFEQEKSSDMLLFQWGTYDWGMGEHFEFNLTRQLVGDGLWTTPCGNGVLRSSFSRKMSLGR